MDTARQGTEDREIQRKRLYYRSWHRGTREMDLLFGAFADQHLAAMPADQLDAYEALLELGDPDLFAWIMGKEPVPEAFDSPVMSLLKNFKIFVK